MCGRFAVSITKSDIEKLAPNNQNIKINDNYNVSPTQKVNILLKNNAENEFQEFNWGLIPAWSKDKLIASKMINARAETIEEKASFKFAIKKRRCIVPAIGYYEWKTENSNKSPYFIYKNSSLLLFGGLWEIWVDKTTGESINSFTIITTESNPYISPIHNRMPLLIENQNIDSWLNPNENFDNIRNEIKTYQTNDLAFHKVSKEVNSPGNNYKSLIEEING